MAGVAGAEEGDVRICGSPGGDFCQVAPESLRSKEANNFATRVVLTTESLNGKLIGQAFDGQGRFSVKPGIELAPEDRQETVGSKDGSKQEPIIRSFGIFDAKFVNGGYPGSSQGS